MKQIQPLVSIGMPIYNAENFLQKALDSLLMQDYTNFELIISDNASTDRTPEICQQYASKDKRVRYYSNKENMGPSFNFIRVLELSQGEYFMWAAHDDIWENFYVPELVNCLETLGLGFVAANFEAQYIDKSGKKFDFFSEGSPFYHYQSENAIDRVKYMLQYNYGNMVYSLYRRESLQKAKLVFVENEIPFLLQIIQRGNWRVLPKVGFYKRTGISTYQQARWEKQGGVRRDFALLRFHALKDYFFYIKYSFKYHATAIKNIQHSVMTLDLNHQERTSLQSLARKLIWKHFTQIVLGYK